VQNHTEKVKVDYLVTEAGGDPVGPNRLSFIYGEKGTAWTRMKFKGMEGHGSAPYKSNNAVVKMAEAIQRVKEYQPPRDTSFTKPFLKAIGFGGVTLALLNQPRTLGFMLNMMAKRSRGSAAFIQALSQMTWSPNVCGGGVKTNTIPGSASLDIDVRILPGQDEEYVREHFRKALGPLAKEVEIERLKPEEGGALTMGSLSDTISPFVDLMESIVKEIRGSEYMIVPMLSPGATDCRFFRKAWSTQAYGFSVHDGSLDLSTLQSLFHGIDERIPIGTLEMTGKGYMELARRFLS